MDHQQIEKRMDAYKRLASSAQLISSDLESLNEATSLDVVTTGPNGKLRLVYDGLDKEQIEAIKAILSGRLLKILEELRTLHQTEVDTDDA